VSDFQYSETKFACDQGACKNQKIITLTPAASALSTGT